jgi:small conductance mechanosensitive channel
MPKILGLLAAALLTVGSCAARAQDDAPPPPSQVPIEALTAETRPLRVKDLEQVAELWLGHLQSAVAETAQLSGRGAEGAASLAEAEARKAAIIQRLTVVLDELEAKGGDAGEYRRFVGAVSDVSVDWFNPEAVAGYVRAWAVSPQGGLRVGLNIVWSVVILVAFWVVSRLAGAGVTTAVRRVPKASNLLRDFLAGGTRRIIMLIGVVVAVSFLGVNITPLVAAIGAAGLVIGLALQGTLSNFASGILILIYRPYDIGDVINAGGVAGKVEAMNLVSTRMLTFDNQVQFVPNNSIWNGVITNVTGSATRRVDMKFGIGYGEDIAKAQAIIEGIVASHPKILKDPEPTIRLHELADSSVNFVVRPWSKTADYWDVYWDVTRAVKERFDAEGVGIPYPQRDLHVPGAIRVVVAKE